MISKKQSWIEEQLKISNTLHTLAYVTSAVFLIACLAQVKMPLPFSPVPITGQTFGIAFLSLVLGRKLAFVSVSSYLIVGALGLPVFANLQGGLVMGPTLGYLFGMLAASQIIGFLADKGYAKNWKSAFLSCTLGSLATFSFGALGLSFFVPLDSVFVLGVLPFLPGDIIKNSLAAALAQAFYRK